MTLFIVGVGFAFVGVILFVLGWLGGMVSNKKKTSNIIFLIPVGWVSSIIGSALIVIGLVQVLVDLIQGFQ